jgi:hypothetical protein
MRELESLIVQAIDRATGARIYPPILERYPTDSSGCNWDVSDPAPSPAMRKAVDGVRELYTML